MRANKAERKKTLYIIQSWIEYVEKWSIAYSNSPWKSSRHTQTDPKREFRSGKGKWSENWTEAKKTTHLLYQKDK